MIREEDSTTGYRVAMRLLGVLGVVIPLAWVLAVCGMTYVFLHFVVKLW